MIGPLGLHASSQMVSATRTPPTTYNGPSTVDGPLFVVGGVRVALTICEDAWSPNGPIIAGRRGRRARRQHQRVAVLRREGARARSDARDQGRRRVGARALREPG